MGKLIIPFPAYMTRFACPSVLLFLALGIGTPAAAQAPGDTTRMLYTKHEYRIPMGHRQDSAAGRPSFATTASKSGSP